jgi:glycosyltransferase involved in cell wall biosynthesis
MRLLVTVTLNPNQLRSHLEPLADLDEVDSIVLVADKCDLVLPKLRTVVPPRPLVRVLGRALAKLVMCVLLARRVRPAWVIGLNLVPHGVTALITGRLCGARTLYYQLGGPYEWTGGGWQGENRVLRRLPVPVPALERLLLRIMKSFTVVVVMGARGRTALAERGVDLARIRVLPGSVDLERFRSGPENAARTYDFVTVSALIPRKRVEDFLHGVARVRQAHPEIRAAVVGTGPCAKDLLQTAQRLGLEEAVDFLGFRADVEKVLQDARVFVLTSRKEGLPIAITEAMASELPVVATDVGEARELIRNGETGFLVEFGDVESLSSRLVLLYEDPGLRAQLGRAGRNAVGNLVRRSVADAYREILTPRRSALQPGIAPAPPMTARPGPSASCRRRLRDGSINEPVNALSGSREAQLASRKAHKAGRPTSAVR